MAKTLDIENTNKREGTDTLALFKKKAFRFNIGSEGLEARRMPQKPHKVVWITAAELDALAEGSRAAVVLGHLRSTQEIARNTPISGQILLKLYELDHINNFWDLPQEIQDKIEKLDIYPKRVLNHNDFEADLRVINQITAAAVTEITGAFRKHTDSVGGTVKIEKPYLSLSTYNEVYNGKGRVHSLELYAKLAFIAGKRLKVVLEDV